MVIIEKVCRRLLKQNFGEIKIDFQKFGTF